MTRSWAVLAVLAFLADGAIACGSDSAPLTGVTTVSGVIGGIVSDTAGRPVLRATLKAIAVIPGNSDGTIGGTSTTDGTGRFSLTLTTTRLADTTITMVVQAVAAGYPDQYVNGVRVHLSRLYPPDTTSLALTLHP